MQPNSVKQFLPSIHNDKKIEVSLENNEAVLKLSTWTEDLGWCCQKTMRLEAEMLDDLHRAIAGARYKLNQKKVEETDFSTTRILSFPTVA